MASSFPCLQVLALCIVLLSGSCLASRQSSARQVGGSEGQQVGECNLENLNPLEPHRRIRHEAGVSEIWDANNQQLQCAGVAITRHVVDYRGLIVPSFNNAPVLIFGLQGQGVLGVTLPGCAETYSSFEESEQEESERGGGGQRRQRFRDQHQKIHHFWKGDVLALPAGVAHWVYNKASSSKDEKLVILVVHDISNRDNQLDQNLRRFFLAGNQQQGQEGESQKGTYNWNNIFQSMDVQLLSQAFSVSRETIKKLQNENDNRGQIIRVKEGLRYLQPRTEREKQEGGSRDAAAAMNGFEETICTMRLRENLISPERADIYTARGGSISTVNRFNLPILRFLQLSAGRASLRPNAMIAPRWTINAHSIMYVTSGSGRLQVVGNSKRAVYDGEIRQGQIFVIPQNFVHMKQAGPQGLEWFAAKTHDNAKTSPLVGKTSVIRAMPIDVLMNSYQLSRDEAESIKYNREEVTILSPQFGSQQQREQGGGSQYWAEA